MKHVTINGRFAPPDPVQITGFSVEPPDTNTEEAP